MPQIQPTTPGVVALCGVVRSTRKFADNYGDNRVATLLAVQAPDGARGLVEVFSDEQIARVGETADVHCRVVGVPHSYNVGEGAERRRINTARHYLVAVAA